MRNYGGFGLLGLRKYQLRRPGGITADHTPTPPASVLSVMRAALQRLETSKRERLREPGMSEDETSDIENDLTYITALSRDLQQMAI